MALHSLGFVENDPHRSTSLFQQAIAAYPEANGLSSKESEERAVLAASRGDYAKARMYFLEGGIREGRRGIVLCWLAAWRVTAMVRYEAGPFDLFSWIRLALTKVGLQRLVTCFHCTGVWVSAI